MPWPDPTLPPTCLEPREALLAHTYTQVWADVLAQTLPCGDTPTQAHSHECTHMHAYACMDTHMHSCMCTLPGTHLLAQMLSHARNMGTQSSKDTPLLPALSFLDNCKATAEFDIMLQSLTCWAP